ncbi:MAG TPA: hypothetical protein VK453_11990 [Micromonosporaceae bacterium]|nr:hypothetical protein [Micromonosporaceae bacterium]
MRYLLQRSIGIATTLAVSAALTLVAVLMPAAPAHAAAGPGSGWSGSWKYYTSRAIEYSGTLPGVRLSGILTDSSGSRRSFGNIQDTADDGRCARAWVFVAGQGIISETTTCGNGTWRDFTTSAFSTEVFLFVQLLLPNGGGAEKNFIIHIPSSTADPDLRTVGTGASWSYYTDTAFQYQVVRPGVKVTGHGENLSDGLRSSLNVVQKTVTTDGCALGRVSATTGNTILAAACDSTTASFNSLRSSLGGQLTVEGCFYATSGPRCTPLYIPEPV